MDHDALLRTLQLDELYLLHHNHNENPQRLQAMLAKGFYEVAANGSIIPREDVVAWLMQKDSAARWEMLEFRGEVLTPSLALLVYRAKQVEGVQKVSAGSWRSSLWRKVRGEKQWQMAFHQATPVH